MASRLERLPAELLDLVLNSYESAPHGDYRNNLSIYHALCLTCKTLREAATPYLYKDIRPDRFRDCGLKDVKGHYRKLANTLCARPSLADHVQIFEASASRSETRQPPSRSEYAAFKRQLKPLIDSGHDQLALALGRGCFTAEVLVLLSLCSQVRTLTLPLYDHDSTSDVDKPPVCLYCPDLLSCLSAVDQSKRPVIAFKKLTHASVSGRFRPHVPHMAMSPAVASCFLAAPLLTELRCSGLGSFTNAYPWICAPATSKVQSLVMSRSNLATTDVVQILHSIEALRECEICWTPLWSSAEGGTEVKIEHTVDTQALFDALDGHSATLERLVLEEFTGAFEDRPAFTSLRHFHKLRKLTLDEELLIGNGDWASESLRDKLPHQLTDLQIHTCFTLENLGDVLDACGSHVGSDLAVLEIVFPYYEELHEEHPDLFDVNSTSGDRPWFLKAVEGTQAVFVCEGQPMGSVLAALADSIEVNGIDHLLHMQIPHDGGDEGQAVEAGGASDEEHEDDGADLASGDSADGH
ncbi:hypothetical protein LTR85_001137 [Meristemomyces frigidus]|nr:hypothetical protein LTR85_001137 [Meristemomyces frigidus]